MRRTSLLLVAGLLSVAGCGDDNSGPSEAPPPKEAPAAKKDDRVAASAKGTAIEARDSEFGRMLFDSKRQAIYIFENDSKDKSNCYGECAKAWPPVLTKGDPRAGQEVKDSLLGTAKRRDGKLQVTYADRPLYFYAHEDPGEVRCHNVNLNGGLWWVVGPDGKRRP